MDESQQLKQLVSADLPSLGKYYREMATEQEAGVLVVNYYPTGEVAQMETRFLKSSQIPRISRQMGLPTLQSEFEQHDREQEMVLAVVTVQIKGVVTVEVKLPASETPISETLAPNSSDVPELKAKPTSSTKTTAKRQPATKTTRSPQTKKQPSAAPTPQPETLESPTPASVEPSAQIEATQQSTVEPETTAKSTSKGKMTAKTSTSKPAKNNKTATGTKTKQRSQPVALPETSAAPIAEPEATPQSIVEPETTAKSASIGKTTSKTSKPATRGKTASRAATKQESQLEVSPETPPAIPEERSDEPG
jgi:hypothetical protein